MKQLKDLAKIDKIAKAGIKTDEFIVREGGKILKPIQGYVPVVEDPEAFKYVPYEFDSEKRKKEPEKQDSILLRYPGYEPVPFNIN